MALTKVTSGLISADASSVDLNIDAGTLYIDSTNNRVGVGTTSPSYPLHVYSSSGDANLEIETTNAGSSARLRLTGSSTGTSTVMFADEVDTNVGLVQYDHTSNFMKFHVADSEAMRIDSTGVGIGTSSPTEKLTVNGALAITGALVDDRTSTGAIDFSGGITRFVSYGASGVGGIFAFRTASGGASSVEAMRIDSSGNVGIGTSSPITTLHAYSSATSTPFVVESTTNTYLGIKNTSQTAYVGAVGTAMTFENNGSERMRITSGGNLLVGTDYDALNAKQVIYATGTGSQAKSLTVWNGGGSGITFVQFVSSSGSEVGSITQNGASAVAYNTSSDYRLKENVTYDWDATTRLKQLKPARFNFIADADTTVDGFLAHEVSSIVPEAIHGEKDEMQTEEYEVTPAVLDDDGNVVTEAVMGTREVPKYQGIDQSKLVPLLVKTIQELEARITALENT